MSAVDSEQTGGWDGTFGDILYIAFIAETSILSYGLKKGNCAKCQFGGGCSSLTMVDVPRGRLMGEQSAWRINVDEGLREGGCDEDQRRIDGIEREEAVGCLMGVCG
jgi:hypothetical protein